MASDKIDLKGFKRIFFVEWAHRAFGNAIGLIFGLPMVYFWARGSFRGPMKKRMLGLLALGGSQGLIGWWMVKSGLQAKPTYHTEPKVAPAHQVSVYRLFVHLNCAMGIFSLLLWNGLTLVRPSAEASWRAINIPNMLKTRKWAMLTIHLLALTIAAGSIVAGLDAGKVFNTWPLMNGQYSPLTAGSSPQTTAETACRGSATTSKTWPPSSSTTGRWPTRPTAPSWVLLRDQA